MYYHKIRGISRKLLIMGGIESWGELEMYSKKGEVNKFRYE